MDTNSFVLHTDDVTEVYNKLISFCSVKGFTVKETKEKYFFHHRKENLHFILAKPANGIKNNSSGKEKSGGECNDI